MLGHASRRADYYQFTSILQAAASRAWTRTRPARPRAFHQTTSQKQSFRTGLGTSYGGGSSRSNLLKTGRADSNGVVSSPECPSTSRRTHCSEENYSETPDTSTRSDYYGLLEDYGSSSSASMPRRDITAALSSLTSEGMAIAPKPTYSANMATDDVVVDGAGPRVKHPPPTKTKPMRDTFPRSTAPLEPCHEDQWEDEVDYVQKGSEPLPDASIHPQEDKDVGIGQNSSSFRKSTSAQSLYQDLIRLSTHPLPPSATRTDRLHQLLRYHSSHPQSHSTSSYNFLISLAISIRQFSTARTLLQEMPQRSIPGNSETKKLSVRFWLRQGKWTEAWMRETEGGKHSLSLLLWLEFLNAAKIFEPLVLPASAEERQLHREACAAAFKSRSSLLMRYRPTLTSAEVITVPPRSMYYFVRWMLQRSQRTEALKLTTSYFQRLPKTLPRSYRRYCTGIVNLHLKAESAEVSDLRNMLKDLLALHPDIRPDPQTLKLVLGAVHTRPGNSLVLDRLRRSYQKKWGADIVDEEILSFLADRARRDRYVRQLKKVIREYEQRRELSAPQAWVPSSGQSSNPNHRPLHKVVYYDHLAEEKRWQFYRDCLQTFEVQDKERKKRKKR
ncbi:hypothetical protein BC629DRAFT_813232 [Irpex lacteus]|nr:hypothetical protein BC629DRAFT_813232 [Irpex lacteus]